MKQRSSNFYFNPPPPRTVAQIYLTATPPTKYPNRFHCFRRICLSRPAAGTRNSSNRLKFGWNFAGSGIPNQPPPATHQIGFQTQYMSANRAACKTAVQLHSVMNCSNFIICPSSSIMSKDEISFFSSSFGNAMRVGDSHRELSNDEPIYGCNIFCPSLYVYFSFMFCIT